MQFRQAVALTAAVLALTAAIAGAEPLSRARSRGNIIWNYSAKVRPYGRFTATIATMRAIRPSSRLTNGTKS